MTTFWEKRFWPLTTSQGSRVCVRTGYVQAWCFMLHSLQTWCAKWLLSEIELFWPLTPPQDRICVCMLLNSRLHSLWYATLRPCSEKVELWPRPQLCVWGGGGLRAKYLFHVAAFVIPFNLICNMTMFWKSWIKTCDSIPGSGGGGVGGGICGQSSCYHVAACGIPFNLRWYATWPCSEKDGFWPHSLGRGGGGVVVVGGGDDQNICCHVAAFVIPFNLIWYATWPCSEKVEFGPHPQGWGEVCGQNMSYHVAAFVIPVNVICNMTMFWKSWILTPLPRSEGGLGTT